MCRILASLRITQSTATFSNAHISHAIEVQVINEKRKRIPQTCAR